MAIEAATGNMDFAFELIQDMLEVHERFPDPEDELYHAIAAPLEEIKLKKNSSADERLLNKANEPIA